MIKCEKGTVEIKGRESDLYAEFGTMMQACYRQFGEEQFNHLVELAQKSDEEMQAMAVDLISKFADKLKNVLSDLEDELD